MKKPEKARIDELTVIQELAEDIEEARRLIMAGEIRSGDRVWEKAGEKVPATTQLQRKGRFCRWVSRGGLKLEKAVEKFSINPKGLRCLDIGASTGGFSDVLLHNNAASVTALDVGYGLLDARIANDPRVRVIDRTNFRLAEPSLFGEPFDLIVTDVSFISLRKIFPNAVAVLKPSGSIIALIKPQFEAERHMVPEGGIIVNPDIHLSVINELKAFARKECGLALTMLDSAPIVSSKKNIEFLSLWQPAKLEIDEQAIKEVIKSAHTQVTTSD